MKYALCDEPWGDEEVTAIQTVVQSNRYTMGEQVKRFEYGFADQVGAGYAVMVNSGSAANLLAIAALVYSGSLPRGSEVIVSSVSWSTTYAPLEQYGMKVVFADIDADTLNISVQALKDCITEKTRLIFLTNLLGNPNEFDEILDLCRIHDIIMIEDNCESLGAKYRDKQTGTIGLIGTYSTFFSHHISTMEGGVVVTDDKRIYELLLSLRAHGWTRDLPIDSSIYKKKDDMFYERFNFIVPGYNCRPLEMQGAIGSEQLKKLDAMLYNRRTNARYFKEKMQSLDGLMRVQKEVGVSSWFGFSIVLEDKLAGKRHEVVAQLMAAGIETRPIVAGNFTRNKVIEYMDYRIPEPLRNADEIHVNGFFIGNHNTKDLEGIDYVVDTLSYIAEKKV